MEPQASTVVTWGMAGLPIIVVALIVAGVWRASGRSAGLRCLLVLGAWLALVGALGLSGVLARFDARPPPLVPVLLVALAGTVWFTASHRGTAIIEGLPLAAIIGLQAFRLPLELVMHEAAVEGVMPVQMSFSGFNFDIVTGATAIVVAALVAGGRAPRGLVVAWNVLGSVLLVTVMTIAITSLPLLHLFGSEPRQLNTWVGYTPFAWLPTVLVPTALGGHVLVFRALRRGQDRPFEKAGAPATAS